MSPRSTIVDFDVKDRLGTKTVWCSCLRLRLKYLSRRLLYPVLAPSQGYNIERLFVTLWLPVILRSRSIDLPSVRSIPTEIDQRVSSESRDVPRGPRLPLICAIPISPQSNDPSISFTESSIHSKSIFWPARGPSSFLTQPSVRYACSPATDNLSLAARLQVLQAVNQGTVGQGLSLRNRKALTVVKSILLAI